MPEKTEPSAMNQRKYSRPLTDKGWMDLFKTNKAGILCRHCEWIDDQIPENQPWCHFIRPLLVPRGLPIRIRARSIVSAHGLTHWPLLLSMPRWTGNGYEATSTAAGTFTASTKTETK